MNELPAISPLRDRYAPDGPYALVRLALSVAVATMINAGMWAIIVVLPPAQATFGVDRASATLPYTLMMLGLAFGTIVLDGCPIALASPSHWPRGPSFCARAFSSQAMRRISRSFPWPTLS